MKNGSKKILGLSVFALAAFVLWTAAVCVVDVRPIGPMGSGVGFAALNSFVHHLTGVHMGLYTLTDWLSILPLGLVLGFAGLGLAQWVRRRSLFRVDFSLFALGGFYALVMAAFLFFEVFVVNYRPVLIDGCLEASYPSSTTLLTLCVMLTAATQLWGRIKRKTLRCCVVCAILGFTLFMVVARLVSGVHWLTDILGGILLSGGLVAGYEALR